MKSRSDSNGDKRLAALKEENNRLQRVLQETVEIREQLTLTLLETRTALERTHRKREEFLAVLGHELRNPLSAIRSGIRLLRSDQLSAEKRTWAEEMIDRQVVQFSRIVDELLDLSSVTQGKIKLNKESINIAALVDRVPDLLRQQSIQTTHTVTLDSDGPIIVEGDPARLEQVFVNLLTNAYKYSPSDGNVTVTIRRTPDHLVKVSIKDTGIGIPAEMVAGIFDFPQGRTGGTDQQDLGIGLTLAHKLTELHGGTLTAHSDGPGRGAEFIVTLPAVR